MQSDNLIQESPYLSVEQKMMVDLQESNIQSDEVIGVDNQANLEFQLFTSFVKEKNALLSYVNDLVRLAAKTSGIKIDGAECQITAKTAHLTSSRIIMILDKYQEQSTILDSVLEAFVSPIINLIKVWVRKNVSTKNYAVPIELKNLFMVLSHMCKTRGQKTVVKFFPHEVSDLEPVTELLHFQDRVEFQIPYILMLWLSIIVLVPFDLTTIDSSKEAILVKRIINISQNYMLDSGKLREASVLMIAKLITRPDVIKSGVTDELIARFLQQYFDGVSQTGSLQQLVAIILTFVEICKTGHRVDLINRASLIYEKILQPELKNQQLLKSSVLKQARVKLAQRIGCIFLKPRVANWRYQRGARSLSANLNQTSIISNQNQVMDVEDSDDDLTDDQFEQLENIIELLLESLKEDDSMIRWTAAKGLGRITNRLNKDFGDQIVQQLYDLFQHDDSESAWHGGCLALAELFRLGLLLPERLSSFIPILERALIYDINLGNHSVGAHVRDAACYVVWSFSRAYSPEIMKPHVKQLSTKLIVVSLFDREVNIRRAASATFQEAVGRQGTFPHGIAILTEADYFTLSNRVNAYLNVSCFVGQYPEYLQAMLEHLAFVKLRHWEHEIRELAAQALAVLSVFNPALIVQKVLTPLLSLCFSKTLHVRHGALLGVSEIIIGLSGNSVQHRQTVLEKAFKTLCLKERNLIKQETDNQQAFQQMYVKISSTNFLLQSLNPETTKSLLTLVDEIQKQQLYKGKGGEIIRTATCHYIHALSHAGLQLNLQDLKSYFSTLKDNLKHTNQEIQDFAAMAFQSLCRTQFLVVDKDFISSELVQMAKQSETDENISLTRGYNMAFGVVSKHLLENDQVLTVLIQTLMRNCMVKNRESDDAETRKQSVKSLAQLIGTIGFHNFTAQTRIQIFETVQRAMTDYACDRRGDVGSWVREEAMRTLTMLVQQVAKGGFDYQLDDEKFYEQYISAMLQQLVEKIDRVREVAGKQLQIFFKHSSPNVCMFQAKDELTALFTQEDTQFDAGGALATIVHDEGIGYLPWRSAEFVFSSIRPLFNFPAYGPPIFKGLITSSGGLTESTMKASQKALFQYLSGMKGKPQQKSEFLKILANIFESSYNNDRVTIPLMKTIEILLQSDYLSEPVLGDDLIAIHSLCVKECNKSKVIVKLMASIGVFANMLQFNNPELNLKAVRSLLFLLYHSFPKVRKITAEKLYTGLLSLEDYTAIIKEESNYELAIEMLSETDWSLPLKVIAEQTKVQFYACFGLSPKA